MLNWLLGIVSVVLAGTALGGLWALLALLLGDSGPWLALLVPLPLTWLLLYNQHPGGWWRALLGLSGYLIALAQASLLMGAAIVAAHLGKGLWPWIFDIGPEMAFAVSRARLGVVEYLCYFSGAVLATWMGFGPQRSNASAARPKQRKRAPAKA